MKSDSVLKFTYLNGIYLFLMGLTFGNLFFQVVIHSEKPKRPDSILDGIPGIGCSILIGDNSKSLWISGLCNRNYPIRFLLFV